MLTWNGGGVGHSQKGRGRPGRGQAFGKRDGGLYQTGVGTPAQGELGSELAPVEGAQGLLGRVQACLQLICWALSPRPA